MEALTTVPIWADGIREEDGFLLETKFVGVADASPLVPGSSAPDHVREATLIRVADELLRYRAVIVDPSQPPRGLEIIVSDERAVPLLDEMMGELDVPGRVVYRAP
jgi:hypothetical protein